MAGAAVPNTKTMIRAAPIEIRNEASKVRLIIRKHLDGQRHATPDVTLALGPAYANLSLDPTKTTTSALQIGTYAH
jgi:hypothetical protein